MDQYAVIWVDTNRQWKIQSFESEELAEETAGAISESGLAVQVVSFNNLVHGWAPFAC